MRNAKDELLVEIEKKIRTTFIGAVSSLEESRYGTLEGEDWDEEFDRLRTEILDKGNSQIRAIRKLMENYQVAPARKYQYKFEQMPKDSNRRKNRGDNNV
jgi:hypothetical protein